MYAWSAISPGGARRVRRWLCLGLATVAGLVSVSGHASLGAPFALSPHYTIRIPAPSATRVGVSCDLADIGPSELTLAFLYRPAPGLVPTVLAYRVEPHVRRRRPGLSDEPVPVRLEANPGGNTHLMHVGPTADGSPLGRISIDYELDLQAALGSARDFDAASRIYQDRMVVTSQFATLRGDVLPVPLGYPVRSPSVAFELPEGWRSFVNARPCNRGFEFPVTFPPEAATRAVRWVGVAGIGIRREVRDLEGLPVEIVVAPTPADPARIATMVWDRVSRYARVFGVAPLRHLAQAPLRGVGEARMMIHALPFPAGYAHRVGGQYLPGTAFFFYAPDDLPALGRVIAHEYLHAYNVGAMLAGAAGPGAADPTWFVEGYTDVQATFSELVLSRTDAALRLRHLRTALVESWALMHGQDPAPLVAELVPGANAVPHHAPTGLAHPGSSGQDALWRDADAYVRIVQGRGRLAVFGLAILLAQARPHGDAFNDWLRILLRDHAAVLPQATPVDDGAIERACREASGDATAVTDFFARYIRGTDDITRDDLLSWLREPALEAACVDVSHLPAPHQGSAAHGVASAAPSFCVGSLGGGRAR